MFKNTPQSGRVAFYLYLFVYLFVYHDYMPAFICVKLYFPLFVFIVHLFEYVAYFLFPTFSLELFVFAGQPTVLQTPRSDVSEDFDQSSELFIESDDPDIY